MHLALIDATSHGTLMQTTGTILEVLQGPLQYQQDVGMNEGEADGFLLVEAV